MTTANNALVEYSYGTAIREGFRYLLDRHPDVFLIGQGLWSPWYVGNSMTDLDIEFGKERVIDTPVSENSTNGIAIGASLVGRRAVVIHPRVDFMILGADQMVNQAAKWAHMLGGQAHPAVTFRGIVNRGGQQGAQHSQALHSWFAHIPGLRVVMPATPADARDLLISSVLCDDPVLYLDDRWLYGLTELLPPVKERPLHLERPRVLRPGSDVTLVGSSYSTHLCNQAAAAAEKLGISCEVIDLRVINPIDHATIVDSVRKTRRLVVVDGGWRNCGLAGEVIAGVCEAVSPGLLKCSPKRVTLTDAPAPTSKPLEEAYYTQESEVLAVVIASLGQEGLERFASSGANSRFGVNEMRVET